MSAGLGYSTASSLTAFLALQKGGGEGLLPWPGAEGKQCVQPVLLTQSQPGELAAAWPGHPAGTPALWCHRGEEPTLCRTAGWSLTWERPQKTGQGKRAEIVQNIEGSKKRRLLRRAILMYGGRQN